MTLKCLALQGAPCIYDVSRLRVNLFQEQSSQLLELSLEGVSAWEIFYDSCWYVCVCVRARACQRVCSLRAATFVDVLLREFP
jgi:hypothetical protein